MFPHYKEWVVKDELHTTCSSGVEWADGRKVWYVNGKLHRLDGPAILWPEGGKAWYKNGKLHRLDGPAIEYPSGIKEWFINGVWYNEKQYTEWQQLQNAIAQGCREANMNVDF